MPRRSLPQLVLAAWCAAACGTSLPPYVIPADASTDAPATDTSAADTVARDAPARDAVASDTSARDTPAADAPPADAGRDAAEATVAWVLACQNDDGGFGAFPGDVSALRPTAWAVELLGALGVAVPRADRVAAYVTALQNADGTFRGRAWGNRWTALPTLVNSRHAVATLRALGRAVPRADALARWVRTRQRADGAFRMDIYPEEDGSVAETLYAVSILRALGQEVPARDRVVRFLAHMQADEARHDGGFMLDAPAGWDGPDAPPPMPAAPPDGDPTALPTQVGYTTATAQALATLALLEAPPSSPDGARDFLARQQHASGGFATGMGTYGVYRDQSEGRMVDTHHALAGLRALHAGDAAWSAFLRSGRVDVARAAAWIAACQNPDGGFARRPDAASRPSDLEATLHAVLALRALGRPIPAPARATPPRREALPTTVRFPLRSEYFQPDQPGQALYLHRIIAPIRAARATDEATAIEATRWVNRHQVFGNNYRNEAALLVEDATSNCGGQSRVLLGLLQATGIAARLLVLDGHVVAEASLGGRWVLLDPMFDRAYRRPDGALYSAIEVHERDRARQPQVTAFGDFRYRAFTIYWPQGTTERAFEVHAGDTLASPVVRAAYPELAR